MNSALFLTQTGELNKPWPANKSLGLILNFYFFQKKNLPNISNHPPSSHLGVFSPLIHFLSARTSRSLSLV